MSGKPKARKSIILRVLLLFFSVYVIFSLGKLQLQLVELRKQKQTGEAQLAEKTLKVNELTRLLESGTEKEIIEQAARERLGYVYPDEQVYIDLSGN